jgi:hypothetical protein
LIEKDLIEDVKNWDYNPEDLEEKVVVTPETCMISLINIDWDTVKSNSLKE